MIPFDDLSQISSTDFKTKTLMCLCLIFLGVYQNPVCISLILAIYGHDDFDSIEE